MKRMIVARVGAEDRRRSGRRKARRITGMGFKDHGFGYGNFVPLVRTLGQFTFWKKSHARSPRKGIIFTFSSTFLNIPYKFI